VLPFLSLVTLPELLRNPTVKDEASASGMTALNGLMLTYPVHQAADILFCQATIVPVGADQLPHVEQTRAIARRFNRRYAPECPVFVEPEALLSARSHRSPPRCTRTTDPTARGTCFPPGPNGTFAISRPTRMPRHTESGWVQWTTEARNVGGTALGAWSHAGSAC
jgi:hypothetical protein